MQWGDQSWPWDSQISLQSIKIKYQDQNFTSSDIRKKGRKSKVKKFENLEDKRELFCLERNHFWKSFKKLCFDGKNKNSGHKF